MHQYFSADYNPIFVIGKETVEIPITDTVEMSQYRPIPIIDAIISTTLILMPSLKAVPHLSHLMGLASP